MKKLVFTFVLIVLVDHLCAQMGMANFQQNLSGTTTASGGGGGGTGVPIDGGISTVIVGSLVYGYKLVKNRKSK